MKYISLFICCMLSFVLLYAQNKSGGQINKNAKVGLAGTVVDIQTSKGISGATIELSYFNIYLSNNGVSPGFSKTSLTAKDGTFRFENIAFAKKYSLVFSAAGYENYLTELLLPIALFQDNKTIIKNVGIIKLLPAPALPENVGTVRSKN